MVFLEILGIAVATVLSLPLVFVAGAFYFAVLVQGVENRKALIKGSCLDPEFDKK